MSVADEPSTEIGFLSPEAPFRPRWWLRGRHLQTIWRPLTEGLRRPSPPSEPWPTSDGDEVRVAATVHDPGNPAAILLHGLEGSLASCYMQSLSRRFLAQGWNVVAYQYRGCGGFMNRARRLYHTGETGDLGEVIAAVTERWPGMRLGLVGISLGGNLVAKWLGEQGDRAPAEILGGVAISPPFDVSVSGPWMDKAMRGLYVRHFLRTLIPKALAKEAQYPGCLDAVRVRRARSFREYDDLVTAPLHGFRDALHYWASVGCGQYLDEVRRPLLVIASEDDPFNPESTIPRRLLESSSWLHPAITRRGGHVGFVGPGRRELWAERRAFEFLAARAGRG